MKSLVEVWIVQCRTPEGICFRAFDTEQIAEQFARDLIAEGLTPTVWQM